MNIWYPTTDRPPVNTRVLVTDGKEISVGSWGGYIYLTGRKKGVLMWHLDTDPCGVIACHREGEGISDEKVTHWMPLPGLLGTII